MDISFNVLTVIVFVLIANGLFATIILLLKKENNQANRYLAILTFLLSLWLCDTFLRTSGIYGQQPNLYLLPIYFSLGFGPLIYLYTLQLTRKQFQFSRRQFIHFIPVLLQFSLYLFLQSKDYSYRRDFWLEIHRPYTYDLELILSFLSLMIYLFLSRNLIKSYRSRIDNAFSDLSRITLTWLNQLHIALFILSVFWLLETIGRFVWTFYPNTPFSSMTVGFVVLFISIGAILQKDLSDTAETLSVESADLDNEESKNERVEPKEVERIQRILSEKELFLVSDLTLKDFASHVGLSARETSRIINSNLEMSFIDFVNQYRIERFKELAKSEKLEQLSLLGIAYESGFNSKSTFNRVFKKMEGKSPTAYLNKS